MRLAHVLTRAELTLLLVLILSPCDVMYVSVFGRMLYISLCRLLWTGSGSLLGFLWRRSTTAYCLEVPHI